jgi:hypothetical protein
MSLLDHRGLRAGEGCRRGRRGEELTIVVRREAGESVRCRLLVNNSSSLGTERPFARYEVLAPAWPSPLLDISAIDFSAVPRLSGFC